MKRKLLIAAVLLLLLPSLILAQTGKLRGLVTDKETGEPLIGANVMVEGTTLGASTDMNGVYVILAIPPGIHSIRASYIGYTTEVIQNIRVNSALTTTQDFQLGTEAIRGEALVVVAERPLIQRNTTNTIRMTTEDDIKNIPLRGLENILSLDAGTVLQDGNLHIRGGRDGEVGYIVDGVSATNPFNNEESITVIQEAIEEIQMQAGGYTAEYGGANSGVVKTTLRAGGPKYKVTLDYRTDDFVHSGEQFLGTSAYGYRNAVATISGPMPGLPQLRFFFAGQHNYMRDRSPTWIEPFEFTGLVDDGFTGRDPGEMLPDNGTITYLRNHLYHNWRNDNMFQGTLVFNATDNLKFRLTGSYQHVHQPLDFGFTTYDNDFCSNLYNYYNFDRQPERLDKDLMASLRVTHILNQTTFYEVGFYYTKSDRKLYDPVFEDDWKSYQDSLANAELGYMGWRSRYWGPRDYSTINNFEMEAPGYAYNDYEKRDQTMMGASIDFSTQLTKNWELRAGGRFDMWTMKYFFVDNIKQYMETDLGIHGNQPKDWESDYERMVKLAKLGGVQFYGYDIDGNETDENPYGPKKPVFGSAYVQNKFEYRDLILNLGLRYEMVHTKALKVTTPDDPEFDGALDWLDPEGIEEVGPKHYILPRFNFSFPVTERTVFYALYGKYIQMPQLSSVYRGYLGLSETVSPVTRSAYGWWGNYVGYTAEPEEIIQYEMGIRQSLTENFAFTVTGYYRDQRNLLRIDRLYVDDETGDVTPDPRAGDIIYCGYVNQDFGTVKGVEMTLELRRTNRLAARVNYTWSDARGTGSDSQAGSVVVSDEVTARYPILVSALAYNQPHRGNVMLDYRFAKGDGGFLEGLGANLIFNFNSGHAYTKIEEPRDLGQADPWDVGVRALRDERGRHPQEALNSSYTPWVFNVDLNLNKVFYFDMFNVDLYVNVLNLFNTKHVINVYPMTGTAEDDGWLSSPFASAFFGIPGYVDFYRTINGQNRWSYTLATGNDLYGVPRQIRVGLRLEINP
jgi:hypothetical protein